MIPGAAAVVIAYLIGGVPFGWILYRLVKGKDIRSVGSGNIGATNVGRAAGSGIGAATLILDAAKGAAAVSLGVAATGEPVWGAAAGVGAVLGHCFPVYLGFRGGKGVATGCGAFLLLSPPASYTAMMIALGTFGAALALTRMVSVGSMIGAIAFPLAARALGAPLDVALWSAAASALIILRHHGNLRRILKGEERRIGGGARKETS